VLAILNALLRGEGVDADGKRRKKSTGKKGSNLCRKALEPQGAHRAGDSRIQKKKKRKIFLGAGLFQAKTTRGFFRLEFCLLARGGEKDTGVELLYGR